ncbi:hypothetical protein KQH41_00775 [bacterium]|nr:hypothetical protein [bacterium]
MSPFIAKTTDGARPRRGGTEAGRRRCWPLLAAAIMVLYAGTCTAAVVLPRFMVLIDEKNMGTYSMGDSERVLIQALVDKGADVVDNEMIRTTQNRDKAIQSLTGSPQAAAALGLEFGADIVIIGRAIAKGSADTIENTSFRSYSAAINLKAIRTDTAEIILTDNQSAAKIHVDDITGGSEALQEAAVRSAGSIIPKLLASHGGSNGGPTKIQLHIGNVSQIWQVAAVKKLLREQIGGVSDVVQRSFVSGIAVFEVYYNGSPQTLAEALTLAQPNYFRVKVVGVSATKLDTQLVETDS